MSSNFTNGSLVMRVWRFDGSGEIMSKFQYFSDAQLHCRALLRDDEEKSRNTDRRYFYFAVCDYENKFQAFGCQSEQPAARNEGEEDV